MTDRLGVAKNLVVKLEGRRPLHGHYWVREGIVTVRSEDGREKSTQAGGSPPWVIARLLLVELDNARPRPTK